MPDTDRLEEQLRRWAEDLAQQVPPYEPDTPYKNGVGRSPRRRWIVAAAIAIVALGVTVAVVTTGHEEPKRVVTTPDPRVDIEVAYERMAFRVSTEMDCRPSAQTLGTTVIESWSDPADRRWRNRFHDPDDRLRDVIDIGWASQPDNRFERGPAAPVNLQCGASPVVIGGTEPSIGGFITLDPVGAQPDVDPDHFSRWRAILARSIGGITQVPGDHADSQGRGAELWRFRTGATMSTITVGDGADEHHESPPINVTQDFDVYVALGSSQVTEVVETDTYAGTGTATKTLTLLDAGQRSVPSDWFSTDSYRLAGSHDGSITTTTKP